ncbi:MAG: MFS transporter [Candidatus Accumulibacter sp.]|jgi:DHA2 family multidrug resistance protein|nr:MFS transporter [Accumulibacter sp.]
MNAPAPLPPSPGVSRPPSPGGPPPIPLDLRLAVGLFGVFLAATMAGLNNRVPGLALADIRGGLGFARDGASWLTTVYTAGELAAMPFAAWFAITFSLRRFQLGALGLALVFSAILPAVVDLRLLLALRFLHGVFSGALIPILMMAMLRFLPPAIRLLALAIFATTATFSPNVALWLAALCVDRLEDWRWVYWHVIPLGLAAMALMHWGLPIEPPALARLKQADWLDFAFGVAGLSLLVVGLDQGVRLDWFRSPLIVAALTVGGAFTALFFLRQWFHPAPFVRLQVLRPRNLWLGFTVFFFILSLFASGVALPANALAGLQGFRMEQSASIGLIVGLPQLVLGPAVAMLLYKKWIDARFVFAAGLVCIAAACRLGSGITGDWMTHEFLRAEILHAVGQPMAVISSLFLGTSVVAPRDGPFVAGFINILRVLGTVSAGAFIGEMNAVRGRFHAEMLFDSAGRLTARLAEADFAGLGEIVARQAAILATADIYRAFAALALALIPLVLMLNYVPPPGAPRAPQSAPTPGAAPEPTH